MEDSLVTRRSRRSTAGNRMEAALAEFRAEDLGQDAEEDNDFIVDNDEQDAFESDFESTDEEGAQEDVDAAAEKMVREEEKKTKKTARSQLERVTAAAHARQKATFNPQIVDSPTPKTPAPKPSRHVSMGTVVDAETGTVLESRKRKSSRRHTMMNTSLTEIRAKDEQEKKSAMPKKMKTKMRAPTQDELIARALDMEEDNVKEHRNYLQIEEEKRKRARVVRMTVEGPLLRWVSKSEQVTVQVPAPRPPAPAPAPSIPPYGYTYTAPPSAVASTSSQYSPYVARPPTSYYHPAQSNASTPPQMTFVYHSFAPYPPAQPQPPVPVVAPPPPPRVPTPPPIERIETVAKEYVIHETAQKEGTPKPLWKETMTAMFGNHVRWDEMKVYTGKGRPLSRPKDTCAVTGQTARYRDPRTGVPFANVHAFQTISKVLEHQYVWSEDLGCYVSSEADEEFATNSDNRK